VRELYHMLQYGVLPIVQEQIINNRKYRFEIIQATNFDKLSDNRSVNGFALNDKNEVLLVRGPNKDWAPPGGAIDDGESPTQALIRELYEEAAVHINLPSIQPLFYQKTFIDIKQDGKLVYVGNKLRYVCKIQSADQFIADPDNCDITEQMYCPIEKLHEYVKWSETIELVQKLIKPSQFL